MTKEQYSAYTKCRRKNHIVLFLAIGKREVWECRKAPENMCDTLW